MKRYGSILLMALALAACSKTPVDPGTAVSGDVEEVITARMVGTRVDFDGVQGLFTWSEGDQIAVHCSAGYNASGAEVIAPKYKTPSITIDANDPAYCTFHLIQSAGQKRDAFAVYPASIVDLTSDGTSLNITLPASYEIGPEGMGTTSPTPMVAVNDPDATELYFKHVGGLLRLTLNDVSPATKVITVNLGKRLTGEFAVNDPDSAVPYIATDDAADEVSFVLSEELADYTDGLVLNVPVPTGTYSMLKVSAKNSNGETVYAYEDKTERFFDAGRGRRVETAISSHAIPLCLEATEVGTVIVRNPIGLTIEYSRDNETWTSTSSDLYLVVNEGDCVYLRGNNAKYSRLSLENDDWNGTVISCDGRCYIYGNIMSLIDGENFVDCKSFTEDFAFAAMFMSSTDLINHPEKSLELPAMDLTLGCYAYMFFGCTGLTSAPSLPARHVPTMSYYGMFFMCSNLATAGKIDADTVDEGGCQDMYRECSGLISIPDMQASVIGDSAFAGMFQGCTALTTAPALPATSLAQNCYDSMFQDCAALTTAPALPATTLAKSCYSYMFSGCTALTTAPELPAMTLAQECYYNMFYRCTSLTAAPDLPATTLAQSCYYFMFYDCRNLSSAPEILPATSLANNCYGSMFSGCTSLTTAPVLPATTLANNCYSSMFYGCKSLVSAPALPATTLANSCYNSMFSGCTSLAAAPVLPATTLADYCYSFMFSGCSNLATAPEQLPAMSLTQYCYRNMFSGCTSLAAAPVLPATTLANSCYNNMFSGCSNLTTAPALPATTLADFCYSNMFYNCSNLTTAPALSATTLVSHCYSRMFSGCSALTTAPELPATTLANNCYECMFERCSSLNYVKAMFTSVSFINSYLSNWLSGVSATGTFVKNAAATWSESQVIPSGWTVETVTL